MCLSGTTASRGIYEEAQKRKKKKLSQPPKKRPQAGTVWDPSYTAHWYMHFVSQEWMLTGASTFVLQDLQ